MNQIYRSWLIYLVRDSSQFVPHNTHSLYIWTYAYESHLYFVTHIYVVTHIPSSWLMYLVRDARDAHTQFVTHPSSCHIIHTHVIFRFIYIYKYIYTYIYIYIYKHVSPCLSEYTYTHTCICTHIHRNDAYTYFVTHPSSCHIWHIHVTLRYLYIYILYIRTYIHKHVLTCLSEYAYTHTWICTHIYNNIKIYQHISICKYK